MRRLLTSIPIFTILLVIGYFPFCDGLALSSKHSCLRVASALSTSTAGKIAQRQLSSRAVMMMTINGDGHDSVSHSTTHTKRVIIRRKLRQTILLGTPLWIVGAALAGVRHATFVSAFLGSITVVSRALFVLMLSMALSTTADAFMQACRSPAILALNALCCFGGMPIVAWVVTRVLQCNEVQTTGTLLLGSVCGGQASNLFTLLAGGDVSLSVVCTLSTTLAGVALTPLLVQTFLAGSSVVVDGYAVFQSVVSLVLGPLVLGIGLGKVAPNWVARISPVTPLVGIMATLVLVAGGAANAAATVGKALHCWNIKTVGASVLLSLAGGAAALFVTQHLRPTQRRAVVVEVLSKSPALAYFLARKHFDEAAAVVPAAAMVTLAVVGAVVASLWSLIPLSSSPSSSIERTK